MKRIPAVFLFAFVVYVPLFGAAQSPPEYGQMTSAAPPAHAIPEASASGAADISWESAVLEKVAVTAEAPSAQDSTAQAIYNSAMQQNQVPLMIQELLRLASSYPASPVTTGACLQIAKFSEMNNRPDLAVLAYRAYLQRMPQANDSLQVHLRLADALRKTGRHEEAIHNYQLVIQRDTTRHAGIVAQDGLAQSFMALKRYKEAVDQIEQLLKNLAAVHGDDLRGYSNLPVVLLNEGLCLEELGRYRDAMRRYGELRRLLPESREAELAQSRLDDLSKPLITASPAIPPGQTAPLPQHSPSSGIQQPGMSNQFGNGSGAAAGPGNAATVSNQAQQPAVVY